MLTVLRTSALALICLTADTTASEPDRQIGDWLLVEQLSFCQDKDGQPQDCLPDGSNNPPPSFAIAPFHNGVQPSFSISCKQGRFSLEYLLPGDLYDRYPVGHDVRLVLEIDDEGHTLTAAHRYDFEADAALANPDLEALARVKQSLRVSLMGETQWSPPWTAVVGAAEALGALATDCGA